LQPLGDQPQTATLLANHAVNRLNAGDVAGALALLQRAQGLVATYALDGSSAAFVQVLRMQCARLAGHYTEALACGDQAETLLLHSNPARLPVVALHRAHTWLNLGQHARAGQALAQADTGRLPPHFEIRRRLLAAKLHQATGQADRADWAGALAAAPAEGWPEWRLLVSLEQALAQAAGPTSVSGASGASATSAATTAVLLRVLQEAQDGGLLGTALTARLHLAAQAAPPDQALEHALAARALVRQASPTLMTWAEAWWLLGQGLQRAGQAGAAQQAWAQGRLWLNEVAAQHLAEPWRDGFLHRHPVHLRYGA
jgi:tetratricopeptide (TPR) repeat protein